mmetsp:Transcript_13964/g.32797  ORF Transcript_13964/g.32797 Transcript_13964/m.32797 type:complete len:291 (+) Transcript_13964:461-1333(+)
MRGLEAPDTLKVDTKVARVGEVLPTGVIETRPEVADPHGVDVVVVRQMWNENTQRGVQQGKVPIQPVHGDMVAPVAVANSLEVEPRRLDESGLEGALLVVLQIVLHALMDPQQGSTLGPQVTLALAPVSLLEEQVAVRYEDVKRLALRLRAAWYSVTHLRESCHYRVALLELRQDLKRVREVRLPPVPALEEAAQHLKHVAPFDNVSLRHGGLRRFKCVSLLDHCYCCVVETGAAAQELSRAVVGLQQLIHAPQLTLQARVRHPLGLQTQQRCSTTVFWQNLARWAPSLP